MGVVLKLAILIFCIRHVMNNGRPGQTTAIYAGTFLVIGLLLAFFQQFTPFVGIILALTFVYDLVTGFVFFWLIDRYYGNPLAFYTIIILGIAASVGIKFLLVFGLQS
ncbi:hypothetical protein [Marinobacter sp. DY40_1A1]|uniref:hypothetical protein n=1 Tax=Marinobacter sp. DY40_1A1 TaxID=2583229 RepID=UPI0019041D86|nr:hypothetical protein [Marinobacter sp. DY40_1A1]MBK1886877.1 hypothetical protein [Marinobacter sp. DY40_1A1]